MFNKSYNFDNTNTNSSSSSCFQDISFLDKSNPSTVSKDDWYKESWNESWGPGPREFPPFVLSDKCNQELNRNLSRLEKCVYSKDAMTKCKQEELTRLKRERLAIVAKQYVGLPYQHHHIPQWDPRLLTASVKAKAALVAFDPFLQLTNVGLDCSNFVSWLYNYALGIQFTPGIESQSKTVGKKLNPREPLKIGDLIYFDSYRDSITDAVRDLALKFAYTPSSSARFVGANEKQVFHVAMYLGNNKIIDTLPTNPNKGVYIRPLDSWYRKSIAYVRRVLE